MYKENIKNTQKKLKKALNRNWPWEDPGDRNCKAIVNFFKTGEKIYTMNGKGGEITIEFKIEKRKLS